MADVPWNGDFDQILRSFCRLSRPDAPIDPDTPFAALGIDSFGVLGLIVETENAFALDFKPSMFTVEVMFTPAAFWDAVQQVIIAGPQ